MDKISYRQGDMEIRVLDDLVKVFHDEAPRPSVQPEAWQVLRNDRLSFQLAFCGTPPRADTERWDRVRFVRAETEGPLARYATLRSVEAVPVRYSAHPGTPDSLYLRKAPGLYPDVLQPLRHGIVAVVRDQWRSLWVDLEIPRDAEAGEQSLTICLLDPVSGEETASVEITVQVLPFVLPDQTFPRTEWFHCDCLADYYHVPIFSEAHWILLEAYIRAAVRRGINMILTPHFTPPLDTAVGWERPTTQLVEVWREEGKYRFDFARLVRWIRLCRLCGVRFFEMSHLFSQWGAVAAPKIVGWENGEEKQLFGWDTRADGEAYAAFLRVYLPSLREVLRAEGVEADCWFHISDEPNLGQLESYAAARELVREALEGCHFFEALSDEAFYRRGCVDVPVCGTDHIEPFLANRTDHLWTYYCTAQSSHVSNCFIAQSSGVTRLYGAQMYKFGIEGSLRWGYNFYYTAYSYESINPFLVNDSGGCFPAGDPFIVYPGTDGQPLESIRMMVLDDAFRDLRALKALEEAIGKEKVMEMVDDGLREPLRFDRFPDPPEDGRYVLLLRRKVNLALAKTAMS